MKPEEFIKSYEVALRTQDWNVVEPLISDEASVTFSDGTAHIGKNKVQKAFEKNFSVIENEKYSIKNVIWLVKEEIFAVYLFDFEWAGLINCNSVSGSGCGTSVLIKEQEKWKLLTEHLGKKSNE